MKSRTKKRHPLAGVLRHDPIPWLLSSGNLAINTFVKRDLLDEKVDVRELWDLAEPRRLARNQQDDGSWRYPTDKPPPYNYDLYETLNSLGILIHKYGLDNRHTAIQKGAEYVFSCQAPEGDYRGIYGNQPSHTYTPVLMELLIEAGYPTHPSIERAFRWLLDTRQSDGGWAIPARTRSSKVIGNWEQIAASDPIEPDRDKPFSHLVTGMVLRAFVAHHRYRRHRAAKHAATMLKSRFFKPDKYTDRRGREYWTKFTYPFTFTDLLTSLDSLGRLDFTANDPEIAAAIAWFREKQKPDGSFDLKMRRGTSDKHLSHWLGLAVCRALHRFTAAR